MIFLSRFSFLRLAPYDEKSYVSTHPPGRYRVDKMTSEIAEMEKRMLVDPPPGAGRHGVQDEVMRRAFVTP